MGVVKDKNVYNAFLIGGLCAFAYLTVYFARNILSAVSPQLISGGIFTTEFIGSISSAYFICYGAGQLINGLIGDRIKARYMMSFGLLLAGVCNFCFVGMTDSPEMIRIVYGLTGFFLSMVYAPMMKVIAENTLPVHATRCSLACTVTSFLGSPAAGALAIVMVWSGVFITSGLILTALGALCFVCFLVLERKGIVRYGQYKAEFKGGGSIQLLLGKHRYVKFTTCSFLAGIVRNGVVFWLPTYFSQYLGYSSEESASIFTVATLVVSAAAFLAVMLYEAIGRKMDMTMWICFTVSTVLFVAAYFVKQPLVNVALIVIAVMAGNGVSAMIGSRYCPGLRDTGLVSSATGFMDAMSYLAASISSTFFGNMVSVIGWGNLILVWAALMMVGVVLMTFHKKGVEEPV